MALGGVLFLALLAHPLASQLGPPGESIARGCARSPWSAVALLLSEAATVALQSAVLVDTVDLSLGEVLDRRFRRRGPGEELRPRR